MRGDMKYIYTNHAKKRITERAIEQKQVIDTIDFPEYTINKTDKIEAYKKFNGKLLKVVYLIEGKFIKIITLYYIT
jgi:hypothetical protein